MFMKRVDSFEQGMRALLSVSQDLADMFGPLRRNPNGWYITSEAHVRAWLGAAPIYRGTGVGVGWSIEHYGNRYGSAYRTGCGVVFGWRYFPGLLGEVANEPPLFFVGGLGEHPAGWSPVELPGSKVQDDDVLELLEKVPLALDGNPFIERTILDLVSRVGWEPAEVPVEV